MTSGSFSVECQSNVASSREHTPMPGVGKQGCLMARGTALLGNRPSPHRGLGAAGVPTPTAGRKCAFIRGRSLATHSARLAEQARIPSTRCTPSPALISIRGACAGPEHPGRRQRGRSRPYRLPQQVHLRHRRDSAATARTNHGRPRDPLLATRCGPAPLGSPMPAPPEPNSRIRRPTSARSPAQSFHHLRDDHHDLGELLSTAQTLLNARSQPD